MKKTLTSFLLFVVALCNAQVKLEEKDLANLISISELYSKNPNATGESFAKTIGSLQTPRLQNITDALIAVGRGDTTILQTRFLARPSNDDLVLWYIIREIHYNRTGDSKKPKHDIEVAKEILSKSIDERWLLDNYYYRIHGGIATLFNSTDLNKFNFEIDSLGFKNETEKAIFFLNVLDACAQRFKVLQMMKNNQKILEYAEKLPKFNGKEYYHYKDFDYPDFDWIGYDKTESYNERHVGNFYATLVSHFSATTQLKDKKSA